MRVWNPCWQCFHAAFAFLRFDIDNSHCSTVEHPCPHSVIQHRYSGLNEALAACERIVDRYAGKGHARHGVVPRFMKQEVRKESDSSRVSSDSFYLHVFGVGALCVPKTQQASIESDWLSRREGLRHAILRQTHDHPTKASWLIPKRLGMW